MDIQEIGKIGTAFFDGTCAKKFQKMPEFRQLETVGKVLSTAVAAGIVSSLVGLNAAPIVLVVGLSAFAYDTYDYSLKNECVDKAKAFLDKIRTSIFG
jgi:hypothetical protein